jgi:hypothetical protein
MAQFLSASTDTALVSILARRSEQLSLDVEELAQFAHFLVIQPGDSLGGITAELGFSPLSNFADGKRFGDPDFMPSWEWIEDHGGWFELTYVLSDDGFGWILLVQDSEGVESELLALCRQHGECA